MSGAGTVVRLGMIGATLTVGPAEGRGTQVTCVLPDAGRGGMAP